MPQSTKDFLCKKRKAWTKQTKAIRGWRKQQKSPRVPSNTRHNRQWRKTEGLRARFPLTTLSFLGLQISISIVMPRLREPLSVHHRLLTVCWLKPSRDCVTKTCKVTWWAHQLLILLKLATHKWPMISLPQPKVMSPKASISKWARKEGSRDRLKSNNSHQQEQNIDLNHRDQVWRVHWRDSKAIAIITRDKDNITHTVRAAIQTVLVRLRGNNKDHRICTLL